MSLYQQRCFCCGEPWRNDFVRAACSCDPVSFCAKCNKCVKCCKCNNGPFSVGGIGIADLTQVVRDKDAEISSLRHKLEETQAELDATEKMLDKTKALLLAELAKQKQEPSGQQEQLYTENKASLPISVKGGE